MLQRAATVAGVQSQTILFSETKKELFSPSSGYRSLQVHLDIIIKTGPSFFNP